MYYEPPGRLETKCDLFVIPPEGDAIRACHFTKAQQTSETTVVKLCFKKIIVMESGKSARWLYNMDDKFSTDNGDLRTVATPWQRLAPAKVRVTRVRNRSACQDIWIESFLTGCRYQKGKMFRQTSGFMKEDSGR